MEVNVQGSDSSDAFDSDNDSGQGPSSYLEIKAPKVTAGRKHSYSKKTPKGKVGFTLSPIEKYVSSRPWDTDPNYKQWPPGVLFTVRSNIYYDGANDEGTPVFGGGLTIYENDFLQVTTIIDQDWWLARVIGSDRNCGLIPSPFVLRRKLKRQEEERKKAKSNKKKEQMAPTSSTGIQSPSAKVYDKRQVLFGQGINLFNKSRKPAEGITVRQLNKSTNVYDLAPPIRPIVIMGPALNGYEVTDKLQQGLVGYLRASFPQTMYVALSHKKSGRPPRRTASVQSRAESTASNSKVPGYDPADIAEIIELCKDEKWPILKVDVDDPTALRNSALMPMLAFIKISSVAVLSKLIKARGASKHLSMQLHSAERYNAIPDKEYDVVLANSEFSKSCYELGAFVHAYYLDITKEPVLEENVKMWFNSQEKPSFFAQADV